MLICVFFEIKLLYHELIQKISLYFFLDNINIDQNIEPLISSRIS